MMCGFFSWKIKSLKRASKTKKKKCEASVYYTSTLEIVVSDP